MTSEQRGNASNGFYNPTRPLTSLSGTARHPQPPGRLQRVPPQVQHWGVGCAAWVLQELKQLLPLVATQVGDGRGGRALRSASVNESGMWETVNARHVCWHARDDTGYGT